RFPVIPQITDGRLPARVECEQMRMDFFQLCPPGFQRADSYNEPLDSGIRARGIDCIVDFVKHKGWRAKENTREVCGPLLFDRSVQVENENRMGRNRLAACESPVRNNPDEQHHGRNYQQDHQRSSLAPRHLFLLVRAACSSALPPKYHQRLENAIGGACSSVQVAPRLVQLYG